MLLSKKNSLCPLLGMLAERLSMSVFSSACGAFFSSSSASGGMLTRCWSVEWEKGGNNSSFLKISAALKSYLGEAEAELHGAPVGAEFLPGPADVVWLAELWRAISIATFRA